MTQKHLLMAAFIFMFSFTASESHAWDCTTMAPPAYGGSGAWNLPIYSSKLCVWTKVVNDTTMGLPGQYFCALTAKKMIVANKKPKNCWVMITMGYQGTGNSNGVNTCKKLFGSNAQGTVKLSLTNNCKK